MAFGFSFELVGGLMMHATELGEGNGSPLQYFCLENPMD